MDKPSDKELFVRASSLPWYADCARRSAARMWKTTILAAGYQLRTCDMSIGAAVGSGVHAGAGLMLTEKATTGRLAPIDAATDAAIEEMRRRMVEDGASYDQATPGPLQAEAQLLAMTKAYAVYIAPKVKPVLVERRLEATVPHSKMGFVLSGQQDVLAREPGRIRDLKTGKARGNYKPQLGSYALLAKSHPEVLGGVAVDGAVEDFVQRIGFKKMEKEGQPEPVSYSHDLAGAEAAAMAVLRMMDDHLDLFLNGDPARYLMPGDPWAFPANPSSKLCGPKYCEAFGTAFCKEHMTDETE
jgi:hypothetical protein